jgi:hypothetical protein
VDQHIDNAIMAGTNATEIIATACTALKIIKPIPIPREIYSEEFKQKVANGAARCFGGSRECLR